jgi:5-(aminomethyl)-3-furanmethanol phosphate kinase
MTACGVRVVKVGGSLFDYAAFLPAWRRWLAEQAPAAHVLIAGGGQLADAIRAADAVWGLGDQTAHWLCIDALAVSARLLAAILKESRLETSWERLLQQLDECQVDLPLVFCPLEFLQQVEQRLAPPPLPHDWSVTSDSIAARIAGILGADELVLLKSADPPACAPPRPPYVDEYFAQAARGLNAVRFVNLRRYA